MTQNAQPAAQNAIPTVSIATAHTGAFGKANELGMRPMQERAFERRGAQYLLNQGLQQAIVVVPEKTIGASFHDAPLRQSGFWADWRVKPQWNLCDALDMFHGSDLQYLALEDVLATKEDGAG